MLCSDLCDRVAARNLTIINPHGTPNTDGFDPDSTSNVLIEDSYFSVGDDAIAIKSGWDCFGVAQNKSSNNIYIRNLTAISPCCAGVCIGSEMSGGVYNVTVVESKMSGCAEGLRVKSGITRGGYVKDIFFHDSTIEHCASGVVVNDFYKSENPSCPSNWTSEVVPVVIDNIAVLNVKGEGNVLSADFEGLKAPADPITRINMTNVQFPKALGYVCSEVSGVAVDVDPAPCDQLKP